MIDKALLFLEDQTNLYFKGVLGPSTEKYVAVGNIARIAENDASSGEGDESAGVILSLVNIEEDRISKNPDGKYRTHNKVIQGNPEILLNLYILFTATNSNYSTAMSRISTVIQCFQSVDHFTRADYPSMDEGLEVLHLDLFTMNFEQVNHLWSVLGGKYLPSVLYRVKMVTIVDKDSQYEGGLISEIELSKGLMNKPKS